MRGWPSQFEEVAVGARLLWSLPGFLRNRVTLEEARATLQHRLEHREADFLALAQEAIFDYRASPYRELLRLAGCEYGDLERLVTADGVEGALRTLHSRGVYLTVQELKGRRPAVRGSTTLHLSARMFRNPLAASHLSSQTSGSRGDPTLMASDLASLRDRAFNKRLTVHTRGGEHWVHAVWGVPGGAAVKQILYYSVISSPPARWFSQIDPLASDVHPRYRWGARALRLAALAAGVRLPLPRHVSLDDPLPIVRWMTSVLRAGRVPHIYSYPSSVVRLCRAAWELGVSLAGAQFTMGGEPTTEARLAVIRRTGAVAVPSYGSGEAGGMTAGCQAPEAADDVHLYHDLHAVIQPDGTRDTGGLPQRALLTSSLRRTTPMILLNVSMGDQAVLTRRSCGCALQRLGWTTHLHMIRSFEKLTGGGVTFLDADIVRVLEEVLPRRFGGNATDYQILEEEDEHGTPRLRLLVHPDVGPVDEKAVEDTLLDELAPGVDGEHIMGLLWREAGIFRVERRAPRVSAMGKIQHLHVERGRIATPVGTAVV
jgi:hypothetical protein